MEPGGGGEGKRSDGQGGEAACKLVDQFGSQVADARGWTLYGKQSLQELRERWNRGGGGATTGGGGGGWLSINLGIQATDAWGWTLCGKQSLQELQERWNRGGGGGARGGGGEE